MQFKIFKVYEFVLQVGWNNRDENIEKLCKVFRETEKEVNTFHFKSPYEISFPSRKFLSSEKR